MASNLKNLSDTGLSGIQNPENIKIAVITAEWNQQITANLQKGCVEKLISEGIVPDNILICSVPGSFELPTAASILANTEKYHAIICLGSVIKGETEHFHFVCSAVAQGVKDVSIKYNIPVIFGVLTDNFLQQAIDRSGGKHGNKGLEAASTALKMIVFSESYGN